MDNLLSPPGAKRIYGCFTQVFQPSDCCPSVQKKQERSSKVESSQASKAVCAKLRLSVCSAHSTAKQSISKAKQVWERAEKGAAKSSSQNVDKSCLNPW